MDTPGPTLWKSTNMSHVTSDSEIQAVLESSRVIAVIGAHPTPSRPASYVPAYLADHGYEIHPVNVTKVGQVIQGRETVAELVDIPVPVDMVDVFRRSEDVPGHLEDILAMKPLPKVVWLQKGIRNEAVAERLVEAGISVVQDRCALAEHRRLGLGAPKGV